MTLIIGYGNPLRRDDGVGQVVAERLRASVPAASVLTVQQLLPEHAADVARASRVIFVDAGVGDQPGAVTCEPLTRSDRGLVDHTLTPATLLALAFYTYLSAVPAWLVRIQGTTFDFGTGLSAPVADAVPCAVQLIQSLVPHEQARTQRQSLQN